MAPDASPYATLGLEPGADAAAVEHAYKRLIKQFHPDRAGGDATRAAEINRAYRELRTAVPSTLDIDDYGGFARSRHRWAEAAPWVAGAGLVALLVSGAIQGFPAAAPPAGSLIDPRLPSAPDSKAIEQPIATAAVDQAIAEAIRLSRDEVGLAEASRRCHREMRRRASVARLDRCAAFDDAVAVIQDRDPLRDRGPFSELAVTGRKMSAATMLSDDYLAIDSRLDRIRLYVELAVAPRRPPPQVENAGGG